MPSKYDYVSTNDGDQNTGTNTITFTLNEDDVGSIEVTSDKTITDANFDQVLRVNSNGSITLTLDVGNLRDDFTAEVVNQSGNTVNIQTDDSNLDGSSTLVGSSSISGDTEDFTVRHITPGVVSVTS